MGLNGLWGLLNYKSLAADVLENVGGEENVASARLGATRLRLKLHDENKAITAAVEQFAWRHHRDEGRGLIPGGHLVTNYCRKVAVSGIKAATFVMQGTLLRSTSS
ncbi:PTS transporter subunit EIIB [Pseudarthrobacter sp. LMD1-1-1.1]|uniref:PTS transporter subunit EIIB n=1 Tax=Pseudarthrobacter sp. LMD1-1-1.1 TaxID=3135242 RepID=UPI00341F32E6